MDWNKESKMFNQTAEYYDEYRPSYPYDIIKTLVQKTNINKDSKLLEIGAGSGKATELFIPYDCSILCIEPGSDLVKKGNEKFSEIPRIKFEEARFENYEVMEEYYDVVFAAQSFHWVSQPIGYEKSVKALKPAGHLALFWNMYITYDNDIDHELLALSNKYGGFADFLSEDGCENRIASITAQIENTQLFLQPQVYRNYWSHIYTPEEYFGFLCTGNLFVQKSQEEKEEAYKDIVNLAIKHNGVIKRPYLCVLYLAQKK